MTFWRAVRGWRVWEGFLLGEESVRLLWFGLLAEKFNSSFNEFCIILIQSLGVLLLMTLLHMFDPTSYVPRNVHTAQWSYKRQEISHLNWLTEIQTGESGNPFIRWLFVATTKPHYCAVFSHKTVCRSITSKLVKHFARQYAPTDHRLATCVRTEHLRHDCKDKSVLWYSRKTASWCM